MNIYKFLLIDALLVFGAIPLIFVIQGGNNKLHLIGTSTKKKILDKISTKMPGKEELLDLEIIARVKGSGVESDTLLGNWKFISVWKKDIDEKDSIFSSLLRVFSANLEIKKDIPIDNSHKLSITVSIKFGIISIEFSGNGYLKGKQPFLPFSFNLIELKSGSNILFSSSIKEPLEKEKSFFEIIALEESRWLSARGQGGALILWLKD